MRLAFDRETGLEAPVSYCPVENEPVIAGPPLSLAAIPRKGHDVTLLLSADGSSVMSAEYQAGHKLTFRAALAERAPAPPLVIAVDDAESPECLCSDSDGTRLRSVLFSKQSPRLGQVNDMPELPAPAVAAAWLRADTPPGSSVASVRLLLLAMPSLGQIWTMSFYGPTALLPLVGVGEPMHHPHPGANLLRDALPPFDSVIGITGIGVLIGTRGATDWQLLTVPELPATTPAPTTSRQPARRGGEMGAS